MTKAPFDRNDDGDDGDEAVVDVAGASARRQKALRARGVTTEGARRCLTARGNKNMFRIVCVCVCVLRYSRSRSVLLCILVNVLIIVHLLS